MRAKGAMILLQPGGKCFAPLQTTQMPESVLVLATLFKSFNTSALELTPVEEVKELKGVC